MENASCFNFYSLLLISIANTTHEQNDAFSVTAYGSPAQALTAKLGQTPLKARTKGQGPLHLSKLLQPASASTPNHCQLLLLTSQSQRAGKMGVADKGRGRQGAAQAAVPNPPGVPPPQPAPGRLRCGSRTSALGLVTSRCHTAPHYKKGRRAARCRSKRQRRAKSRPRSCSVVKGRGSAMAAGPASTERRRGERGGRLPSNRPGGCGTRAAAWQTAQRRAAQGERRRPRAAEAPP